MLFTRYSDVSFLLRSMKFEELSMFIVVMLEERQEEQLKEVYYSNPFQDKSYNEFKEELLKRSKDSSKSKEQKEVEALNSMNKALEMLGGDFIGS